MDRSIDRHKKYFIQKLKSVHFILTCKACLLLKFFYINTILHFCLVRHTIKECVLEYSLQALPAKLLHKNEWSPFFADAESRPTGKS